MKTQTQVQPQHLTLWKRPANYFGQEWHDWYPVVGQSRDSNALERSNFRTVLKALGGESETVIVVRESHWAVGWVEWIGVRRDDGDNVILADGIKGRLEDYPVCDEEDYSREESEEADQV